MLEAAGVRRDTNRIARSTHHLARILRDLSDPSAEGVWARAVEISNTVSGTGTGLSDEDVYDDLVAYM